VKRQIFRSTIFRIAAIVIILVLPINILTLVLSSMVLDKNQEQMAEDFQNTLNWNVENFTGIMSSASKRLTYLSFDDSEFIALAKSSKKENKSQDSEHLSHVSKTLKSLQVEYPWMDLMFFHFPEPDYLVCAGYPGMSYNACREKIRLISKEREETSLHWKIDEIEGNSVLIGLNAWNDSEFGIMINLERLLSRLNLGEDLDGKIIFFADQDGTVYTKQGETYLAEQEMTLAEITRSKQYEVFTAPIEKSNLMLVEVVDWDQQMANFPVTIRGLQILSVILAILVIPLLLIYVRKWMFQPLNRLVRAMEKIEQGELDYRIKEVQTGQEFKQINRSFNHMMDQVNGLKIDVYEKELERKNIKMQYLSQQIQSHFILNAMNILYSYEKEEYHLIQKLILCISKYFQYIVKLEDDFVLLEQEMKHIENYLEIQKARYPDLFYSIIEYDPELSSALVPPLLVQNFVENAIKHSLQIGNKITIFVIAEKCEEEGVHKIRVRMADTGKGISDEMLEKIQKFRKTKELQPGMGVGIRNAIERLENLYGCETKLNISRDKSYSGTNVEIILLLHYAEEEEDVGYYEGFVNRR